MPARLPPRVTVGLIGLTGPVGVLPRRYSDAVVADQRSRSFSLTDFLDLISHHMIAAFAAAGAKYRPHRAADVGALAPGRQRADPVAEVLLALTGYATPGLAERLLAGAAPLRHYAGFFSAHPRSADRLEALASDWLGRPVKVEQFAGAWMALPRRPAHASAGRRVARCVWPAGPRCGGRRARLGPAGANRAARSGRSTLPTSSGSCRIGRCCASWSSLVRAFVGFEVGFAVNPVLARDAVPPLVMSHPGEPGAAGAGPLLGWNTWLPTSAITPRRTDADDALVRGGNC